MPIPVFCRNPVPVSNLVERFQEFIIIQEVEEIARSTAPKSSKSLRLPRRPDFGSIGSSCIVHTNHFLVTIADVDLHQYHVSRLLFSSLFFCLDIGLLIVLRFLLNFRLT